MAKTRLIRPSGRKGAAIWVAPVATVLHLADCDYFGGDDAPVLATVDQERTLRLCLFCRTRMTASLGPMNRRGPRKLSA
jgi:hypothetical protein